MCFHGDGDGGYSVVLGMRMPMKTSREVASQNGRTWNRKKNSFFLSYLSLEVIREGIRSNFMFLKDITFISSEGNAPQSGCW